MANPITVDKIPYGVPALGQRQDWADGRKFIGAYYDGVAPATTVTKGDFVFIQDDSDGVYTPQIEVAATGTAGIYRQGGIVCETVLAADNRVVWVQIAGDCEFARVEGGTTDVDIGDTLKGVDAQNYLVQASATDLTTNAFAVAKEAITTAVPSGVGTTSIFILGRQVLIGT